MREHEYAIFKRLKERWREAQKPLGTAQLLTIWFEDLDRRLCVDFSLPSPPRSREEREEVLEGAWNILRNALECARELAEPQLLTARFCAPVTGSVPEEAGIFDVSAKRLEEPPSEGKAERRFEKVWWHPWVLRESRD